MKTLSWIATTLSIIGIVLNAYLIIWCWAFWLASNVLWIIWSVKKKEWSQVVLWNIFFLSNIYGWYKWSTLL